MNRGSKQIQTKDWELVKSVHLHFGMGESQGQFSWYESVDREPGETIFGSIKLHRRSFSDEVIYLKSIFIFEKGPYIQLWWSENEENVSQVNKIIKVDGTWYKVEPHENLRIERCLVNKGEVKGIVMQVVDKVTRKVYAEIRVGKHY